MSSCPIRVSSTQAMVRDRALSFRNLPQELIDHTIDHLYDDHATLKNCSLVCHAWLHSSRTHLFSKICLKNTPISCPSELCQRLIRLFTTLPNLVTYAREVEVLDGAPLGVQAPPQTALAGIRSSSWVPTDTMLPKVLSSLTHVRHLEFGTQSATLDWDMLSSPLQNAIYHVFSLSSLTYLCLRSWTFARPEDLTGLLACCQNLQGLTLTSICVSDEPADSVLANNIPPCVLDNEPTPAPTGHPCRLQFLTIEHIRELSSCGPLRDWLLSTQSAIDFGDLRELRVAHFDDLPAVEKLLAKTGDSLEHLHFKPKFGSNVYAFNLGVNSNLRSLKLTLEEPDIALLWVHTLLGSISSTNVLEHVCLEFYTDLKRMVDGWAELDSLLLRPEMSSLRQVEIGLFTLTSSPEFVRVREELTGLQARGVLRMYRLGLKKQKSNQQLLPRISRHESS